MNMAGLDMDVLPEKTITDEVIERYGRLDGYEDIRDERERAKIGRRKTKQRTKIKDSIRSILEEMSDAIKDPNVEQPTRDYDGLYTEGSKLAFMGAIPCNQMTILYSQELVFENQRVLLGQEYDLYDHGVSYRSKRIDPVEDDDDTTSGHRY
ncbi:hypothetical protein Syun_006833 [Stephania yunnanensis]|uniref:Uncharacterized protein n=1 Tax=Stephania yunnanensis TaxID=152371 RepID=A0AAP0PXX3_9MAGN